MGWKVFNLNVKIVFVLHAHIKREALLENIVLTKRWNSALNGATSCLCIWIDLRKFCYME